MIIKESQRQPRISWGIHGFLNVSLGPARPKHSISCGGQPLKRPYNRFRGDRPYGEQPAAVLLSPRIPPATWVCPEVCLQNPLHVGGVHRLHQGPQEQHLLPRVLENETWVVGIATQAIRSHHLRHQGNGKLGR
jgi:hypothetical protein